MKIINLKIKGMTCGGCSASVERQIGELNGILNKNIDHQTDSGRIEFNEDLISEEEIIKKINEGHYKVEGSESVINERLPKIPECPECKKPGDLVPNTVFRSNLRKKDYLNIDLNSKNYICLDPDCNVAYYNDQYSMDKSALKRELWYKKGSKRKVLCYCNNIDDQQINEAVVEHHLLIWEEIMGHYRTKINEKCDLLNPTGSCCRELVNGTVSVIKNSTKNLT